MFFTSSTCFIHNTCFINTEFCIFLMFNTISFIILASQKSNTFLHNDAICYVAVSQTNRDVREWNAHHANTSKNDVLTGKTTSKNDI